MLMTRVDSDEEENEAIDEFLHIYKTDSKKKQPVSFEQTNEITPLSTIRFRQSQHEEEEAYPKYIHQGNDTSQNPRSPQQKKHENCTSIQIPIQSKYEIETYEVNQEIDRHSSVSQTSITNPVLVLITITANNREGVTLHHIIIHDRNSNLLFTLFN